MLDIGVLFFLMQNLVHSVIFQMNMLALSFRIVFYVRVYDEYDYPLLSEGLRISFWMVLFGKTIAHTDIKQDSYLKKKNTM